MRDVLEIGIVLRPHGIKGEIKVKHYCDSPDDFSMFEWVYLKQGKSLDKREIINARTDSGDVFLLLAGVVTRNDAELAARPYTVR